MTAITPAVPGRERLAEFLERMDAQRPRLIFGRDATASREPTWDVATSLTAEMFQAVAAVGGIDVQLVYYRGAGECVASRWFSDGKALETIMSEVRCRGGRT